MSGGIYSDERCPVCGASFIDNKVNALICPNHPKIKASTFKVRFGKLTKRFAVYSEANRFLTGLRFKTDEKTFDARDYKRDNPMSFINMSERWIKYKKEEVRPGSFRSIRNHLDKAQRYFGNRNVKDIRYGDLEDLVRSERLAPLDDKTKHNVLATLHTLFVWLKKRQEIASVPEFPVISYELGYRTVVDKNKQIEIMEEVKRIAPNQKTYLGIMWLSTYISIRPNEMRTLKEGNIDVSGGYFLIPHPKEKKYKAVPLVPEDVDILKTYDFIFPAMPFFRHDDGRMFGRNHFYRYWKKACGNLGIEGVDLYGGTRHSSARALREFCTPEEIRRATMTATNKAFERYYRIESDECRSVYQNTKGKVVDITKAKNE
jgi:hypothetical protein